MQVAPARSSLRGDLLLLLLLLGIGAAVKGWVWANTTVLTRDGIGFLEYASRLNQEPWGHVLRNTVQHPLYPFEILAVAKVYARFTSEPLTCYDWEFCAHLANFLAGLLLVVPMYFVGKRLGGRGVGFGAALLFQVMPVPVRVTVDTLTEGTYLLFAALALWTALIGLDTRRLRWLCLAGACGGLAYLARPEGALLPMSIVLTLLGLWWLGRWEGWRKTGVALAGVSAATLLVVVPYWWTIGGLSAKETFRHMLPTMQGPSSPTSSHRTPSGRGLLLASRFQPGVDGEDYDVTPLLVVREVGKELVKGFHYIVWLPACWGLALLVRRFRAVVQDSSLLLILVLGMGNLLILFWLGYRAHYVSERHTMLLVMLGCWPALLAVQAGATWLAQRWSALQGRELTLQGFTVALLVGFGLVQAVQPLHEHRLGHRYAGEWLKTHFRDGDQLIDAYGWVGFYAGQRTPPHTMPLPVKGRLFLVLEEGERDRIRRTVIDSVPRQKEGTPAFMWPIGKNRRVIVYEIPPRRVPPPAEAATATETTSAPARN